MEKLPNSRNVWIVGWTGLDTRSIAAASRGRRFQNSEATNVNAPRPSGDNVDDRWRGR